MLLNNYNPNRENWMDSLQWTILTLVAVNLLMPAISLFQLSRNDFGSAQNQPAGSGLSLIHHLLRLFAVNIPYLSIRIYLWGFHEPGMSIFILKNVLGIFATLRALIPEFRAWIRARSPRRTYRTSRKVGDTAKEKLTSWFRMATGKKAQTAENVSTGGATGGGGFEEVSLQNPETSNKVDEKV